MQCVLSIIQFSEADLLSVYVLYILTFQVNSVISFFKDQIFWMQISVTPKLSFFSIQHLLNIAKPGYFTIKSRVNIECHNVLIYTTV